MTNTNTTARSPYRFRALAIMLDRGIARADAQRMLNAAPYHFAQRIVEGAA